MDNSKHFEQSMPLDARDIPLEERTLPAVLKRQAQQFQKPLIEYAEKQLSYQQALDVAGRVAGTLHANGIGKGDRVLVMLPNCMEMLELYFGCGYLGAIFVPVNTACRAAQLNHQIDLTEPAAIVTSTDLLGHMRECGADLSSVETVWLVPDPADGHFGAGADATEQLNIKNWEYGNKALPPQNIGPDDPLAILFTSGTTGPSKGVICPHAQFFWWGILTAEALGMQTKDRTYTVLPMFHTNALNCLWQVMLCGATYCFGSRFSASGFISELIATDATISYLLGSMVYILMKQPPSKTDREHRVRMALSPATSKDLTRQFHDRFGVCLLEGYGSTETNFVFSNRHGSYEPGSMGRPLPEFDVRLADELDRPLTGSATGELLIRNHEPFSMASGYFRNAEATLAAWKNHWFHTGDRVRRDANGVYFFVDRLKDSIRRRGENISSWEVEQALIEHPGVRDAAVIGVPSELGEEEVMAFVIPQPSFDLTASDLVQHLQDHIAYFAVPKYIEFLSEFPSTENGKVKKYLLKQRGVGANTITFDIKRPSNARKS